jgi:hypothetical protein
MTGTLRKYIRKFIFYRRILLEREISLKCFGRKNYFLYDIFFLENISEMFWKKKLFSIRYFLLGKYL